MKVLIYVNSEKDVDGVSLKTLITNLEKHGIEYVTVGVDDTIANNDYSAMFVIGGDGTILRRTEYVNNNDIPIIGINGGKLGYLTEFERSEIESAVVLFVENKLKRDCRATLSVNYNGKEYLALNDAVIHRIYTENKGMITSVSFYIDGNKIDTVYGDGIIVATPTGSTAYSLSAGGTILAPGINAFSVTPISAHSLSQRPVIYSSNSECVLKLENNYSGALYVDGKFIAELKVGDTVTINKAKKDTVFLRKEKSNFYKKLSEKISSRNIWLWVKKID